MSSTSFRQGATVLALTLCVMTAAQTAAAQNQPAQGPGPQGPGSHGRPPAEWSFSLGAGVMYAPDYEGSNDYKATPLPIVELSWRDRVRLTTKGGPGLFATPYVADGFRVDLGVRYNFGRDESDNTALKGLGDLNGGAVGVVKVGYEVGPMGVGLEIARDLGGDRDGLTATARAEYAAKLFSGRARVTVTPHVTWADDAYMSNSFGVTTAQAARSARHYARYDAGAGLKDAGIAVGAGYIFSKSISAMSRVGYSRLLGDAADSPLVDRDGDANQFSALLGVTYRW